MKILYAMRLINMSVPKIFPVNINGDAEGETRTRNPWITNPRELGL